MNILINKLTNIVEDHNRVATPIQISIGVPDAYDLIKIVSIENGLKQKENTEGDLLYKDNIIINEETGDETYDEVIEKIKILKYEEKEFNYTSSVLVEVDPKEEASEEEIPEETPVRSIEWTQTSQVPSKWIELDPVMIKNYIGKSVSVLSNPEYFTSSDILESLYQDLLDDSQMDYIIADVFLSEFDIDLNNVSHSANTGPGFVQLLPHGQCKLKQTVLDASATHFELIEFKTDTGVDVYLAGKKFENGVLDLIDPIESGTIKFINTTDKLLRIYSYAIGYQEVI